MLQLVCGCKFVLSQRGLLYVCIYYSVHHGYILYGEKKQHRLSEACIFFFTAGQLLVPCNEMKYFQMLFWKTTVKREKKKWCFPTESAFLFRGLMPPGVIFRSAEKHKALGNRTVICSHPTQSKPTQVGRDGGDLKTPSSPFLVSLSMLVAHATGEKRF